jgi:hypothetical protein
VSYARILIKPSIEKGIKMPSKNMMKAMDNGRQV